MVASSVSTFLLMVIVCRDSRNFRIETWTFLVQEYDGSGRKQYCEQAGNSGENGESSGSAESAQASFSRTDNFQCRGSKFHSFSTTVVNEPSLLQPQVRHDGRLDFEPSKLYCGTTRSYYVLLAKNLYRYALRSATNKPGIESSDPLTPRRRALSESSIPRPSPEMEPKGKNPGEPYIPVESSQDTPLNRL